MVSIYMYLYLCIIFTYFSICTGMYCMKQTLTLEAFEAFNHSSIFDKAVLFR